MGCLFLQSRSVGKWRPMIVNEFNSICNWSSTSITNYSRITRLWNRVNKRNIRPWREIIHFRVIIAPRTFDYHHSEITRMWSRLDKKTCPMPEGRSLTSVRLMHGDYSITTIARSPVCGLHTGWDHSSRACEITHTAYINKVTCLHSQGLLTAKRQIRSRTCKANTLVT